MAWGAVVRDYVRWSLLASMTVASCTSLWRFHSSYMHYQHDELRRVKHAEFVLASDACTGHVHGSTDAGSFVDCAGAKEAVETAMPYVNAMARAAEDWNLCGQGRCYQLAEQLLYALLPVSTLGVFLLVVVVVLFANSAWWHRIGSTGRAKNVGILDTGVRVDHHCLTADGFELPDVIHGGWVRRDAPSLHRRLSVVKEGDRDPPHAAYYGSL